MFHIYQESENYLLYEVKRNFKGNTPPLSEIIWVKNVRAIVVCGFLMGVTC